MTEGRNEGKKYTKNTRKQSQSEQNMSTLKITSSTGRRRQLLAGNLIGQNGGSGRPSNSDKKAKTS